MKDSSLAAIRKKITGKVVSEEESLVTNICLVMREFHLGYEEIKELPFPTFSVMLKVLEKESKKKPAKGMQKYVK